MVARSVEERQMFFQEYFLREPERQGRCFAELQIAMPSSPKRGTFYPLLYFRVDGRARAVGHTSHSKSVGGRAVLCCGSRKRERERERGEGDGMEGENVRPLCNYPAAGAARRL